MPSDSLGNVVIGAMKRVWPDSRYSDESAAAFDSAMRGFGRDVVMAAVTDLAKLDASRPPSPGQFRTMCSKALARRQAAADRSAPYEKPTERDVAWVAAQAAYAARVIGGARMTRVIPGQYQTHAVVLPKEPKTTDLTEFPATWLANQVALPAGDDFESHAERFRQLADRFEESWRSFSGGSSARS